MYEQDRLNTGERLNPPARFIAGIDLASGAWYKAVDSRLFGRTPDGVQYYAKDYRAASPLPRTGDDLARAEGDAFGLVAGVFPTVHLRMLAARPEAIERIERSSDGGWIVTAIVPAGRVELVGRTPEGYDFPDTRLTFEIAPDGRPERISQEGVGIRGWDIPGRIIRYDPRSDGFVPTPVTWGPGDPPHKLVEVEYAAHAGPNEFSIPRVRERAMEAETYATPMIAPAVVDARDKDTRASEPRQGTSAPPARPGPARFHLPWLITGIVVVVLAGGVWLWKRFGSPP